MNTLRTNTPEEAVITGAFLHMLPEDRFNRARAVGLATIHLRNARQAIHNGLSDHADSEVRAALAALETING